MTPQRPPEDLWTQFALGIFRVNGLIIEAGEGISRPIGQSSARWQVLGRAFRPQTVAQMARDIGHARQSVQRIADDLVAERLLAYEQHPTDGRTKLLSLTAEGQQVLAAIYERQVEWSERILSELDLGQLAQTIDALNDVAETLDAENKVTPQRLQRPGSQKTNEPTNRRSEP